MTRLRRLFSSALPLTLPAMFGSASAVAQRIDDRSWLDERLQITVRAGVFEFDDPSHLAAELGLELALPPVWNQFRPTIGGMLTSDEGDYDYGGLRYDIPLARRWRISPLAAGGYYDAGRGEDLGGRPQIRTGAGGANRSCCRTRARSVVRAPEPRPADKRRNWLQRRPPSRVAGLP